MKATTTVPPRGRPPRGRKLRWVSSSNSHPVLPLQLQLQGFGGASAGGGGYARAGSGYGSGAGGGWGGYGAPGGMGGGYSSEPVPGLVSWFDMYKGRESSGVGACNGVSKQQGRSCALRHDLMRRALGSIAVAVYDTARHIPYGPVNLGDGDHAVVHSIVQRQRQSLPYLCFPAQDDLLKELEKEFTSWYNEREKARQASGRGGRGAGPGGAKTLVQELEDLGGVSCLCIRVCPCWCGCGCIADFRAVGARTHAAARRWGTGWRTWGREEGEWVGDESLWRRHGPAANPHGCTHLEWAHKPCPCCSSRSGSLTIHADQSLAHLCTSECIRCACLCCTKAMCSPLLFLLLVRRRSYLTSWKMHWASRTSQPPRRPPPSHPPHHHPPPPPPRRSGWGSNPATRQRPSTPSGSSSATAAPPTAGGQGVPGPAAAAGRPQGELSSQRAALLGPG